MGRISVRSRLTPSSGITATTRGGGRYEPSRTSATVNFDPKENNVRCFSIRPSDVKRDSAGQNYARPIVSGHRPFLCSAVVIPSSQPRAKPNFMRIPPERSCRCGRWASQPAHARRLGEPACLQFAFADWQDLTAGACGPRFSRIRRRSSGSERYCRMNSLEDASEIFLEQCSTTKLKAPQAKVAAA